MRLERDESQRHRTFDAVNSLCDLFRAIDRARTSIAISPLSSAIASVQRRRMEPFG
jgi:hypothetical protein